MALEAAEGYAPRAVTRDPGELKQRQSEGRSPLVMIAAAAVVLVAVVLLGLAFFGGGDSYTVKLRFLNAGQLVKGNLVQVAGSPAGTVKSFDITDDGQAEVEIEVDTEYAPLHEGTRAIVRQAGQSSTAGRYIELMLPATGERGEAIADGGQIGADRTTGAVELDQFFNIFDKRTRTALRGFFKGSQRQYAGRGEQANAGLEYLSPSLASSSRLFRELTFDRPALERFLVDSSRFVTALAERRDDLAPLIANANATTRALGSEKEALAELISLLPDFMRTANTTYVNLRAALDDVDPLVAASKPVARKLGPVLDELRPFARDARPTVRNVSRLLRRKGKDNDLLELNRTYPALADIAVDTKPRTVDAGGAKHQIGSKRGSFPESARALTDSAPIVAHGRPYTTDFVGWMDDFSHTGAYDALGSFSRSQQYFNVFSPSSSVTGGCPGALQVGPQCTLVGPLLDQRGEIFKRLARIDQYKRCPGASEEAAPDGSNVFSPEEQAELDCEESARATGAR